MFQGGLVASLFTPYGLWAWGITVGVIWVALMVWAFTAGSSRLF